MSRMRKTCLYHIRCNCCSRPMTSLRSYRSNRNQQFQCKVSHKMRVFVCSGLSDVFFNLLLPKQIFKRHKMSQRWKTTLNYITCNHSCSSSSRPMRHESYVVKSSRMRKFTGYERYPTFWNEGTVPRFPTFLDEIFWTKSEEFAVTCCQQMLSAENYN